VVLLLLIILVISLITYDSGPCSNRSPYEKEQCLAEYAILNHSVNDCGDLDNRDLREYCIQEIGIKLQNIQICNLLVNQTQGACITDIAQQKEDISICENVKTYYWFDVCLKSLSVLTNKTDRCFEIGDGILRDECIMELMPTRNDFELCKKITDATKRHRCMRNIAIFEDDVERCKIIQDPFYRDSQCYKKFAQNRGDKTICDRISIGAIRVRCYERVLNITLVDPNTRGIINAHFIEEFDLDIRQTGS
jgi:hypothetical protein